MYEKKYFTKLSIKPIQFHYPPNHIYYYTIIVVMLFLNHDTCNYLHKEFTNKEAEKPSTRN